MRLAFLFLGLVGLAVLGLATFRPSIELTPAEAVRLEVREVTTGEDLGTRIISALARDDVEEAAMYAAIAEDASLRLPEDARTALQRAGSATATLGRNARQLADGFLTGEANSLAGLSGAVAADLTVIGDIRDIGEQGGHLVQGEPVNELILGLSVVGVAATGATVASGGTTLSGRIGVSLLKFAARTGALTADFARTLGRLVSEAVDMPGLKELLRTTKISDSSASREALSAYARSLRGSELVTVLNRMEELRGNAGAVETVRLMKFVRTTDDLDDITEMSKVMGKRTRGVVEITGKTSLRAFKSTLNLFDFLIGNLTTFFTWVGGIFAALLGRRALGFLRPKA